MTASAPFPFYPDETLGGEFPCGAVTVPEDWSAPDGRSIDLLARLQADPIKREDGTEITLDDVTSILRTAIGTQHSLVPCLPRLVDELGRGETSVYDLVQGADQFCVNHARPAFVSPETTPS